MEDLGDLGTIAEASAQSNKEWSDAASVVLENSTVGDSHNDRIHGWDSRPPWLRSDSRTIIHDQHLSEVLDSILEDYLAKHSASYRVTLARERKSLVSTSSRLRAHELMNAASIGADCIEAEYQGRRTDRLGHSQFVRALDLAASTWQVAIATSLLYEGKREEMILQRMASEWCSASGEVSSTTIAPDDGNIFSDWERS